jgi:protein KRI1
MSNPFDESDDDAEPFEKVDDLVINKSFADKFESQERRKDLLRAKELLDDDDESDSEVEDDEGELISASLDIEILKVINKIRKKDPKIYDKSTSWFEKADESDEDNADDDAGEGKGDESKSDKNTKKKRYKDVLREQLLTHGADIEHDDSVRTEDDRKSSIGRPTGALAYDEEQRNLRKAFLQSVGGDDDNDDEDDVFRVRAKNPAEIEQEEIELKKAMTEMRELGVAEALEETEKSDAFLLDYISKQSWKSKQKYSVKDEEADSSDDNYEEEEEELDKIDLFEHKYNFRFEELQGAKGGDGDGSVRTNVIGMGLQSLQVRDDIYCSSNASPPVVRNESHSIEGNWSCEKCRGLFETC